MKESDILYINVRPGCDRHSLYHLIGTIARDKQDIDTASFLSQSTVKIAKKNKVLQLFLKANFKLICVDRSCDDGVFWSHFVSILEDGELCIPVIAVSTVNSGPPSPQLLYSVHEVQVKGLKEEAAKALLNEYCSSLSNAQVARICNELSCNPVAIRLFGHFLVEFSSSMQDFTEHIQALSDTQQTGQSERPVDAVLKCIFSHLDLPVKSVLNQLSQLRKPLPLLKMPREVDQLVRLTLLTKETFTTPDGIIVNLVSMQTSLLIDFPDSAGDDPGNFNVVNLWLELLSKELQELIVDAEKHAWPFIPEKW